LHLVEHGGVDYRFVGALHIVLRDFTIVAHLLLGQEVIRPGFVRDSILKEDGFCGYWSEVS
jgi:hypothetical protein